LILTVTLNFALDVTYHTERFERGETARIETFSRQAGGKGVNSARVLHRLGREVVVTGVAGGLAGRAARAELGAAGIRDELVEIDGESRLSVMVVERDGQATGFSEPGPVVTATEWRTFGKRFEQELLPAADAVVIAGSLPRGVSDGAYAQLIRVATAAGVPTLLDADGTALELGVAARPTIVKVNRSELESVAGHPEVVAAAQALRRAGAGAVVITQGASGLIGVTEAGELLRAAPPEPLTGNPTGAGDAASAVLVAGLLDGVPWSTRLVDAAAMSAAAVCAPLAGWFDEPVYRRLRGEIIARELDPG
jgi:tagatose 6-phosphate kinase